MQFSILCCVAFFFSFILSCGKERSNLASAENKCSQYNTGKNDSELIKCMRGLPREDILKDDFIQKYLQEHPAYVSLTTSPQRIRKIFPTLETIDQDIVTKIFVTLPMKYKDLEEYPQEEIHKLEKFSSKIEIIRPQKDLGPISKMLFAIEHVQEIDPLSIVISIDDDQIYSTGMFGQMIKAVIKSPTTIAAGYHGQAASFWNLHSKHAGIFEYKCIINDTCDIIEGFTSIAYIAGSVPTKDLRKFNEASKYCKLGDDVVINYTLGLHGIKRKMVQNDFTGGTLALGYGFQEDALHRQNDYKQSYQWCIEAIEALNP